MGAPLDFQSGMSWSRPIGSITAPDRMCAPTSDPFSSTTTESSLPAAAASCFRRMAVARPAGPAPTTTTSHSIASRGSFSGSVECHRFVPGLQSFQGSIGRQLAKRQARTGIGPERGRLPPCSMTRGRAPVRRRRPRLPGRRRIRGRGGRVPLRGRSPRAARRGWTPPAPRIETADRSSRSASTGPSRLRRRRDRHLIRWLVDELGYEMRDAYLTWA